MTDHKRKSSNQGEQSGNSGELERLEKENAELSDLNNWLSNELDVALTRAKEAEHKLVHHQSSCAMDHASWDRIRDWWQDPKRKPAEVAFAAVPDQWIAELLEGK